jgi:hypothetical protein
MKKYGKILTLTFAVLALASALFACNPPSPIVTEDTVVSLEVLSYPMQYYAQYSALNLNGGKLLAVLSDGTEKEVNFTDEDVSVKHYGTKVSEYLYDMTITYKGKSVTINYWVYGSTDMTSGISLELEDMQIKYTVGGNIDYNSAKFVVAKSNGKSTTTKLTSAVSSTNKNFSVNNFSTETTGERTMIIQYYASVFKVNYTVVTNVFALDYSLSQEGLQKSYFVGDTLVLGGAYLNVGWSNATTSKVLITADMVSGFDTSTPNSTGLTMSIHYAGNGTADDAVYDGTITYYVCTADEIKNISVVVQNDENKLDVGENLVFNKSYLKVFLESDDYIVVFLTNSKVELGPWDTSIGGQFTLNISYNASSSLTFSTTMIYEVVAYVSSVSILNAETIKLNYTEGESFDFGTAVVRVTLTDNTYVDYNVAEQFALATTARNISIYT